LIDFVAQIGLSTHFRYLRGGVAQAWRRRMHFANLCG